MNFLLFQIVISCVWFFTSCVVDFVAIPTVFRELHALEGGVIWGGQIGVNLFRQFNMLEIFWAFLLLAVTFFNNEWTSKLGKIKNILVGFLFIIAILYTFYLSPHITAAHKIIMTPGILPGGIDAASGELDFFHRAYVSVEKIKVLGLLALIIFQGISWKRVLKNGGAKVC